MKTAYLFAATTAALFIFDDSLRASWVFAVAFFFGAIGTTLFKEGERLADEKSKGND